MINLKSQKKQNSLRVDKDTRMILGIVAIELGDIKDYRGFSINDEFLTDLVAIAKKQKEGVLSNFGHNWDNLGKRLGRATNWRREGKQVKYDLTIFEAADKSPGKENMGLYVMDLAAEDDKAIMNSISFQRDYFYQLDSQNKKIKVWYYDKKVGWVTDNPDLGKVYPKLKALISTDIVDEGAATNSLFSTDDLELQLHHIINHPNFNQMMEQHGEDFTPLAQYYDAKNSAANRNFGDKLYKFWHGEYPDKNNLQSQNPNIEMENNTQAPATEEPTLEELQKKISDLETENTDLKKNQNPAAPTTVEPTLEELQKKISDLEAENNQLKKMPAAPATDLSTDDSGEGDEELKSYETDEMTQTLRNLRTQKSKK